MGIFTDGKSMSTESNMGNIDEAVMFAMEKAGDNLVDKLAKALVGLQTGRFSTAIQEDIDEETMKALAKVASSNVTVEGANFATLGRNEEVASEMDIDAAIGAIGEIE